MSKLLGFWSYVHDDDDAEEGRISQLAEDVKKQFGVLTGEQLELFLDKRELKWGDEWRAKIDARLASVAFFVPVLTPRFFLSVECRRELQYFIDKSALIGIKELVLPLHYVDVPSLSEDSPRDPLIRMIAAYQWEDWRDTRFDDRASSSYRRSVAKLAGRLVEVSQMPEQPHSVALTHAHQAETPSDQDNAPGLLDLLEKAETSLPLLTETLLKITDQITAIGTLVSEGASNINQHRGRKSEISRRLEIARKLAKELSDPVGQIRQLADDFITQLYDVDAGVRAIVVELVPGAVADPNAILEVCEFFSAIRSMAAAAEGGLGATKEMVDVLEPVERISRDLRPVLRRLREGLVILVEGQKVTDEWVRLIDASGIDCDNALPLPA